MNQQHDDCLPAGGDETDIITAIILRSMADMAGKAELSIVAVIDIRPRNWYNKCDRKGRGFRSKGNSAICTEKLIQLLSFSCLGTSLLTLELIALPQAQIKKITKRREHRGAQYRKVSSSKAC